MINGQILEEIRLPENWLTKFQMLEYTSFLLGIMAFDRLDGLLIICGAFSFFDLYKQILLQRFIDYTPHYIVPFTFLV